MNKNKGFEMPKLKDTVKNAVDHVVNDNHGNTLDQCIKSLSNNGVQLCKKGEFTPLSESDIRGLNPDLGALGTSNQFQQCMDKFDERGFEKCKVQEVKETISETVSNLFEAPKDALHSDSSTGTHQDL